MSGYRQLAPAELQYYYTNTQLEGFQQDGSYEQLEQMVNDRIALCCKMPGALNIPVGEFAVNAPGIHVGELGAQCLRDLGLSGVEPRVLYDVCRARHNLEEAKRKS